MEKYGVQKEILHEDLRNEEAMLMQKMQGLMTKTASNEKLQTEQRLNAVRNRITELDLGGKSGSTQNSQDLP